MEEFYTLEHFAWEKFAEEDDDGINLVLMDPNRKLHRDMAEKLLKGYMPARIDGKGKKYYNLSDL